MMKKLIYFAIAKKLVMLFLFFATFPAQADTADDIQRAQTYLNNLTTAKAEFVQTAGNGNRATGTFYLNRPGRLRFEYDDPVHDFIVADGRYIYFWDAELQEQSNAPIGKTLADFILRPDLRLNGDDIRVTDVQRGGGLLQMTLVQSDDPNAGSLKLGFTEDPFTLRKWRVTDPQGGITEISLANLQTGLKLRDTLFYFYEPKLERPRYNN